MAKKRAKDLGDQIAQLAAVVREAPSCPACGKSIPADATTCPHCDTPIHEGAELHAQAAESLAELERHLEEAAPDTTTEGVESPPDAKPEVASLASAAEVAETVPPPVAESREAEEPQVKAEEVEAEPAVIEEEEPEDLQGFITEIEAEVGAPAPAAPAAQASPKVHPVAREARRRAPRARPRRAVPIAAGALVYLGSLVAGPLLGRLGTASGMVLGSVLVFAGISAGGSRSRPSSPASRRPSADYVCPLCGTGIPAHATQCPTCGALFEE